MRLSPSEKKQFVEKGYLVRRLQLDPALVRRAVDLAWQHMDPQLVRDDPRSWHGDVADSCQVASIEKRRGRMKLRECLNKTPWLNEMIYGHPEIRAVIADLLGETGGPRRNCRGLYPIFPSPALARPDFGGMDGHPFQVGCVMYLSDVGKDSGAFSVWEGSHRIMRFAFTGHASWTLNDRLDACRRESNTRCRRLEFRGPTGTTVFWHHRLLHGPTVNQTDRVRHALVADFVQSGWEARRDEPFLTNMWDGWAVSERDTRLRRRVDRIESLFRGVLEMRRRSTAWSLHR